MGVHAVRGWYVPSSLHLHACPPGSSKALLTYKQLWPHILYEAHMGRHMHGEHKAAAPQGSPAHGHERCAVAEGNLLMQIVGCRYVHSICFYRSRTTIVKTKSYLQIVTSGSADPTCFSRKIVSGNRALAIGAAHRSLLYDVLQLLTGIKKTGAGLLGCVS